jgi:hypothetical protein
MEIKSRELNRITDTPLQKVNFFVTHSPDQTFIYTKVVVFNGI